MRWSPRSTLRTGVHAAERLLYGRGEGRFCPVCGRHARRFARYRGRPDARCVWCSSLERHRLVWTYLLAHTPLFDGSRRRILHVAPERCLESRLRARFGTDYVTTDLNSASVDVRTDVMNLSFADDTFDFVYCSHVLEHVADDRRAMGEFRRTLKPDGRAILLVPILSSGQTVEDPAVVDPAARARLYGQHDHVRAYGPDYVDRLVAAGFVVDVLSARDVVPPAEAESMCLRGDIYVCSRVRQPSCHR